MEAPRKKVNVYTEGAGSGDHAPGGWAAVMEYGGHTKEISGFMAGTNSKRMEIFAAISGLGGLKEACDVTLWSTSDYVVNAFTEKWLEKLSRNNWKTEDGGKPENIDLWIILSVQTRKHHVKFVKVNRPADNPYTGRSAELAKLAIEDYSKINPDGHGNDVNT